MATFNCLNTHKLYLKVVVTAYRAKKHIFELNWILDNLRPGARKEVFTNVVKAGRRKNQNTG